MAYNLYVVPLRSLLRDAHVCPAHDRVSVHAGPGAVLPGRRPRAAASLAGGGPCVPRCVQPSRLVSDVSTLGTNLRI